MAGDLTKGGKYGGQRRYRRYRKKPSLWKVAKSVRSIRGLINVEKKFKDTQTTGTVDYGGTIYHLTSITQGDQIDQRNGNSILLKSLFIRGQVRMDTTGSAQSSTVRIILFQDNNDNNAVAPTVAQVLQTVGSVYAPYSPLNVNNYDRFRVLCTQMLTLNNTGANTLPIKMYKKLNTHCRWQGSTASANRS